MIPQYKKKFPQKKPNYQVKTVYTPKKPNFYRPPRPIFGLFPLNEQVSAIPLKNLDIQVDICNSIARIEYAQTYFNENDNLLECEFLFPIDPKSCFDSLRAEFEDTIVEGIIKKKEEAKEEYKQSVDQGKTVAYAEIVEDAGDIIRVKIGNIPPKKDIKIVFSYIDKLEIAVNKFWCYKLYSTITPRYTSQKKRYDESGNQQDDFLLSKYPTISSGNSKAFPWNLIVSIQSPKPIISVRSPSHTILSEFSNEKHCCKLFFDPTQKELPNKDFVLYFENGQEKEPTAMITPAETGYVAMVNFVPQFENVSVDDAYAALQKQSVKKIYDDADMAKTRGEFIFLIDRSGSMSGRTIDMAKSSLSIFLKSLPINSKYNVVSFGSSFEYLHKDSVDYNKQNLQNTLSQVETFKADFGGTEIYSPLDSIFKKKSYKTYPRNIFLLTDGAVNNTSAVLQLIRRNNHKARVFTIGIGSGCSAQLIKESAKCGKGRYEFVESNDLIMSKVVSLLDAAMSPCVDDFQLTGDNFDAIVESISPNPINIPFLLRDQEITFFIFLRNGFEKSNITLKLFNSMKNQYEEISITLDSSQAIENNLIPKLAFYDMIKRLEDPSLSIDQSNKDVFFAAKSDMENQLLDLSLQYQILSKKTAFICQVTDKSLKHGSLEKKSVIIPTIQSIDSVSPTNPMLRQVGGGSGFMLYGGGGSRGGRGGSRGGRGAFKGGALQPRAMPQNYNNNNNNNNYNQNRMRGSNTGRNNAQGMIVGGLPSFQKRSAQNYQMPQQQYQPQQAYVDSGEDIDDNMNTAYTSLSLTSSEGFFSDQQQKNDLSDHHIATMRPGSASIQKKSKQSEKKKPSSSKTITTSKTTSKNPLLDVINNQEISGFWEISNTITLSNVLGSTQLPSIPEKLATLKDANNIWLTILVLFWLEQVHKSEQGVWTLIHRKGTQWLKSAGVNISEYQAEAQKIIK